MSTQMEIVELGALVGSFPAIAMLAASFLLSQIETSTETEAMFQNFAGGLILAATSAELFPLLSANSTHEESLIGISIGFPLALGFIHGVEYLIDIFSGETDGSKNSDHEAGEEGTSQYHRLRWEEEGIQLSYNAIINPQHKSHIKEHLIELNNSISNMQIKANTLVENTQIANSAVEEIAEFIDEEIHKLEYKLDHTRRLLQGAETGGVMGDRSWIDAKKPLMQHKLVIMKQGAEHLLEHINSDVFNVHIIHEMHVHMDEMEHHIHQFHENVQSTFTKWRRSRPMIIPNVGATLPSGLILPVIIDACVDGFLIGLSCALSPKAGYILSAANCLEMSFLGMALTVRVAKCTGSSPLIRNAALVSPPVLMFLASIVGAAIGSAVIDIPILFVILVSFGIVALLFLVCNELLIEAHNSQGDEQKWWISVMIFLGIYLVLLMDFLIPSGDTSS